MIESLVVQRLLADPAVAALVGERVEPLKLPQKPTLPALVYSRVSTKRVLTHDGPGPERPRIQVDCWASTPREAKDLAAAVRACLDAPELPPGDLLGSFLDNELDLHEPESGLYRVMADYFVWAAEAA